jgi:pheromone shutdown protein TraB
MLDVVQVAMEEAQRLNANVLYVDQDVQVSLLSSTKAFCSKLHNLNKFV